MIDGAAMTRIGAVDVYYPEGGGATAALVVAEESTFAAVVEEHTAQLAEVAPYQPGALYLRELPAIVAVVARTEPLDLLVVDGLATLDPQGTAGLGAHAHRALGIPVIGVAKTGFRTATHAIEVRRGTSTSPLYVTAVGIAPNAAADLVLAMAGPYRIPDALRRVDRLSRTAPAEP